MSGEPGSGIPPLEDFASLRRGRLRYFPVVPGRVEFAAAVRKTLLEERPAAVAVELPGWLEKHYRAAIGRLPEMSVIAYPEELDSDRGVYLVIEPADPFVEAVRTAMEIGAEILFLEPDTIDRPHLPDTYPDTYSIKTIRVDAYVEAYRIHPQPRNDETADHASAMAWRLQGAAPDASVCVVVSLNLLDALLDAMETPRSQPSKRPELAADLVNPHPACLAEICSEAPFLNERYERYRVLMQPEPFIDRRKAQFDLLKDAERNYEAQAGEKLTVWQRRNIAKYTRNLALIDNQMVASLFDVTAAARAVVDDNYGWEVWHAANAYAWQQEHGPLETLNLSGEDIYLRTRRMRLRRRQPRKKTRLMPRGLKPRAEEKYPGEWAEQIDGASICSYPPEDIVIEDYGKLLKRKARSMLSEERVRVEPFTTSVLDGVDIRETIRNWHTGNIYVRKFDKRAGDVGAVIVVFDEDRQDRYTYLTTWLGEHQNESDMAYYATHPFDHMVGPGIGRAEYGGFLMVLPPRRMFDVWSDPDYDFAETKPERLLLAALDYSVERHVVYVAAKPPRSLFRSVAAHLGKSILYVPIGQLNPEKMKRIRVVHVLDSHDRRKAARDYIW